MFGSMYLWNNGSHVKEFIGIPENDLRDNNVTKNDEIDGLNKPKRLVYFINLTRNKKNKYHHICQVIVHIISPVIPTMRSGFNIW